MKKYMETQISGDKINVIPVFAGFQKCDAEYTFGTEKGTFNVDEGNIFIICRDDVTSYKADAETPWEYIWIAFKGNGSERLRDLPPVVSYAHNTFLKIKNAIVDGETDTMIFNSYLLEILHNIFEDKPQTDILAQINNFIEYNYMEEITVEGIAESVHLNRR